MGKDTEKVANEAIVNGKRYIQCIEPNGFKQGIFERFADSEGEQGDQWWEEEETAAEFIRLGWCKCVQTGEAGERVPGSNGPLKVKNLKTEIK